MRRRGRSEKKKEVWNGWFFMKIFCSTWCCKLGYTPIHTPVSLSVIIFLCSIILLSTLQKPDPLKHFTICPSFKVSTTLDTFCRRWYHVFRIFFEECLSVGGWGNPAFKICYRSWLVFVGRQRRLFYCLLLSLRLGKWALWASDIKRFVWLFLRVWFEHFKI